ncbi:Late transcription factor VLTF-4 (1), partial [Monkeypox virus]
VVIEEY